MYESQAAAAGRANPIKGHDLRDGPESECMSAYNALYASQESLLGILHVLRDRLQPVLRDQQETKPSNGPMVGRTPASEVHGQFVAASERTAAAASLVSDLIERLTV